MNAKRQFRFDGETPFFATVVNDEGCSHVETDERCGMVEIEGEDFNIWFYDGEDSKSRCGHKSTVDTLSRRRQGFESPRERQLNQ